MKNIFLNKISEINLDEFISNFMNYKESIGNGVGKKNLPMRLRDYQSNAIKPYRKYIRMRKISILFGLF